MTFKNILDTHSANAVNVGGNYQDACNMLKQALNSKTMYSNIDLLVHKHEQNSKQVGGNFLRLIQELKKELSNETIF